MTDSINSEALRVLGNEIEKRMRRVLSDMMCEKYITGRYSDVSHAEWREAAHAQLDRIQRATGQPDASADLREAVDRAVDRHP
jgi:hypothetical protein